MYLDAADAQLLVAVFKLKLGLKGNSPAHKDESFHGACCGVRGLCKLQLTAGGGSSPVSWSDFGARVPNASTTCKQNACSWNLFWLASLESPGLDQDANTNEKVWRMVQTVGSRNF